MSLTSLHSPSTFSKARRKQLLRRLRRALTGKPHRTLLSLEEVQDHLRSYGQSYAGLRAIPVDKIIGSVSRVSDFEDDFLPVSDRLRARWQSLEQRYPEGGFPPIVAFKVGDAYFVADGHHRVAIAKQQGVDFIDAEVTEVHTPYEVTPETNVTELVHLGQLRIFMEESGLKASVPGAQFTFTRPEAYRDLLDNVKVHGWDMMMTDGRYHSREEIAQHWFAEVYLPTIVAIKGTDLSERWAPMTVDDIFLWVTEKWRKCYPVRGPSQFDDIVEEAAEMKIARPECAS